MSDGFVDNIAEQAMLALKGDDPQAAARSLRKLLKTAPDRLDLHHALAVTELRLGDPPGCPRHLRGRGGQGL